MYFTERNEHSSTIPPGLTISLCDIGNLMKENDASNDSTKVDIPADKCRHHGIFRRGSLVHHSTHSWRSTLNRSTYFGLRGKFKFQSPETAPSQEETLPNCVAHQQSSRIITADCITSTSTEEKTTYTHTSVDSSILEVPNETAMETTIPTTWRKKGLTSNQDYRHEQFPESTIQVRKRKRTIIKSWLKWKPQQTQNPRVLDDSNTNLSYTPVFELSCDNQNNTNDNLVNSTTEISGTQTNINNITIRITVPKVISSTEYDEYTRIEYPQLNSWSVERLEEIAKTMYELPNLSFSSETNLNNDIDNLEEDTGESTNTSASSIDLNIDHVTQDTIINTGSRQGNTAGDLLKGKHQAVEVAAEVDKNLDNTCYVSISSYTVTKGIQQSVLSPSNIGDSLDSKVLLETQKHLESQMVYNNVEDYQEGHLFENDGTSEPSENDSDVYLESVYSYDPVTILVPTIREDKYMLSDLKTSILEGERIKSIYHPQANCLSDDENKPYNIQDPRFFGVEALEKFESKAMEESQSLYSKIKFDDFSEVVFYNGFGTLRQTTEESTVKLTLQTLRNSIASNHDVQASESMLSNEQCHTEQGRPDFVIDEPFNRTGWCSTFNNSNLSLFPFKKLPKSILKSKVNKLSQDESIRLSECDSINVVDFMKLFNEREQVRMDALDDLGDQRERQVMLYYQNFTNPNK